ncbi:hypothetical protein GCM10020219_022100 [Nonomuraea dietziae]
MFPLGRILVDAQRTRAAVLDPVAGHHVDVEGLQRGRGTRRGLSRRACRALLSATASTARQASEPAMARATASRDLLTAPPALDDFELLGVVTCHALIDVEAA